LLTRTAAERLAEERVDALAHLLLQLLELGERVTTAGRNVGELTGSTGLGDGHDVDILSKW
jgi:hypothetical protein